VSVAAAAAAAALYSLLLNEFRNVPLRRVIFLQENL
jgi:hypothetical protein